MWRCVTHALNLIDEAQALIRARVCEISSFYNIPTQLHAGRSTMPSQCRLCVIEERYWRNALNALAI